jgi:hypothetical protein
MTRAGDLAAVNGLGAWIACGPHTKEGISKESMAARTGGGTGLVLLQLIAGIIVACLCALSFLSVLHLFYSTSAHYLHSICI